MTAYRNEIIKDNYVEDANPQLSSFQDLNMGGRNVDLGFHVEKPKSLHGMDVVWGMQD